MYYTQLPATYTRRPTTPATPSTIAAFSPKPVAPPSSSSLENEESSVESSSSASASSVGLDSESVGEALEDLVGDAAAELPKTEALPQWIWTWPWASPARESLGQLLKQL